MTVHPSTGRTLSPLGTGAAALSLSTGRYVSVHPSTRHTLAQLGTDAAALSLSTLTPEAV